MQTFISLTSYYWLGQQLAKMYGMTMGEILQSQLLYTSARDHVRPPLP